jgi:1-aminocyclopropane-1-carboxylate deaminase/D-cysteine desulfhydrase-like pyridoxal-dependent ACC family enzyme
MVAIAAMCKEKGWQFIYYTKPISKQMQSQQSGNFFEALSLGMQHKVLQGNLYKEFIATLSLNLQEGSFVIHQGGADRSAKEGMHALAQEIVSANLDIDALATPSGTGTTALFLALALPHLKVYTVPCIGDEVYLIEQMQALHRIPENLIILKPKKKYHFAKLYPEFLDIYSRTKEAGVEFDLLYAPSMWMALLSAPDEKILYIHSGGVSGNKSMLQRYKRKAFYKEPL